MKPHLAVAVLVSTLSTGPAWAGELTLDDLFPADRVLDVRISVAEKSWDEIRHQTPSFYDAMAESRKEAPIEGPYTYVEANVTIDGVEFPGVGLRKKGFLGSLSTTRPALKIKLNHVDPQGNIGGLTHLTFSNNKQDPSLVSQFLGLGRFAAAGSPCSRCAFATITVNGSYLGVYTHVESVKKPLLEREFGDAGGTLYEGTIVDFHEGWEGAFEHKLGKKKRGRRKIAELIAVLDESSKDDATQDGAAMLAAIGELVDLDGFFRFWALEGLLASWDGYSGLRNNYMVYLHPRSLKFHFMPWGADALFEIAAAQGSDSHRGPVSVRTSGLVAHRLYRIPEARERYRAALNELLEKHWDEGHLLAEIDRIETLLEPHVRQSTQNHSFAKHLDRARVFVRGRREKIAAEIADGMPEWNGPAAQPAVVPESDWTRSVRNRPDDLWSAARRGDVAGLEKHLATADVNAADAWGSNALTWAVLLGRHDAAKLLIARGADVNFADREGLRPLDHAAKEIEGTLVEYVQIAYGIDIDADVVNADRPRMRELLAEHGAKRSDGAKDDE